MSCQHRPPIEALLFPHAGRTEGEGGKTGSRRVMAGGFSAWWKRSVTRLPNKHQMEPFVKITILGLGNPNKGEQHTGRRVLRKNLGGRQRSCGSLSRLPPRLGWLRLWSPTLRSPWSKLPTGGPEDEDGSTRSPFTPAGWGVAAA